MKAYFDIVNKILSEGVIKHNRTGVDTLAIPGAMFEHDMSKDGFPLLTTKRIPLRLISSELEFFIKGITDKKWLQDRNNHIWDEWCSPNKVPYGHDEETKKKMAEERELGPIYGFQWRHFGGDYFEYNNQIYGDNSGVDQLKNLVNKLKTDPTDRRMIVSAWSPTDINDMALPPCHYGFQVTVIGDKLNLMWNQRSVDTALGLPFNIASYGLLLHLLAKETGFKEGKLIGFLGDTHIYTNHIEGLKEQLSRVPKKLPTIHTDNKEDGKFDIFNWEYTDSYVENYEPYSSIKFDIAV
jgi:thymidylate synthase